MQLNVASPEQKARRMVLRLCNTASNHCTGESASVDDSPKSIIDLTEDTDSDESDLPEDLLSQGSAMKCRAITHMDRPVYGRVSETSLHVSDRADTQSLGSGIDSQSGDSQGEHTESLISSLLGCGSFAHMRL